MRFWFNADFITSSNMKSSVIHTLLKLILLMMSSITAQPVVKTKLSQTASLPCFFNCGGYAKWIVFNNKEITVAWCDQSSCHAEDGFVMPHDQYLKGNLTLIISAADYSKRTLYTCQCDGKDVCDVRLGIEAVEYNMQIDPGGSLTLDVPIPEQVHLTFQRPGDASQSSSTLCTVNGRHVQCDKRTMSKFALTLKDVMDSDAGVYTVWDTVNKEEVSKYIITVRGNSTGDGNVTIKGKQQDFDLEKAFGFGFVGFVLGVPSGIMFNYFRAWILRRCSKLKKKEGRSGRIQCDGKYSTTEEKSENPECVPIVDL